MPWDNAPDSDLTSAQIIVRNCHRGIYGYRRAGASAAGEADFFSGYERESCPRCGSDAVVRDGFDSNGVRRWRCRSCGRGFGPATGTIFEGRRLPVADWTEFLLEAMSFDSMAGIARSDRRSETTPSYWLAVDARGGNCAAPRDRRPARPSTHSAASPAGISVRRWCRSCCRRRRSDGERLLVYSVHIVVVPFSRIVRCGYDSSENGRALSGAVEMPPTRTFRELLKSCFRMSRVG